jgi:hypothetical protein
MPGAFKCYQPCMRHRIGKSFPMRIRQDRVFSTVDHQYENAQDIPFSIKLFPASILMTSHLLRVTSRPV